MSFLSSPGHFWPWPPPPDMRAEKAVGPRAEWWRPKRKTTLRGTKAEILQSDKINFDQRTDFEESRKERA